ncbi:Tetratricopeptide TPR_2 repeat protein (fragment) [Candidatus Sulfopaludibacter sp. SbA3]
MRLPAVAALFAIMALGSRLWLGAWPFDGALELSCVCLVASAYFHIAGRRHVAALPDPAALLEEAFSLVHSGRIDAAIALLAKAIRESPQLWQAFQYRGELYLVQQNFAAAAEDFSAAIRLAPEEQHLYTLRDQASGSGGAVSGCETTPESHGSEER